MSLLQRFCDCFTLCSVAVACFQYRCTSPCSHVWEAEVAGAWRVFFHTNCISQSSLLNSITLQLQRVHVATSQVALCHTLVVFSCFTDAVHHCWLCRRSNWKVSWRSCRPSSRKARRLSMKSWCSCSWPRFKPNSQCSRYVFNTSWAAALTVQCRFLVAMDWHFFVLQDLHHFSLPFSTAVLFLCLSFSLKK